MAFVKKDVQPEDWDFFNSLDLRVQREHITAKNYSSWVINEDRSIIFTRVQMGGRDYGDTYALIWDKNLAYIYVESRAGTHKDGVCRYHWDIRSITASAALQDKKEELLELIKYLADFDFTHTGPIRQRRDDAFVIDNIAEPKFVDCIS